jgi:hypothetical protein
MLHMLFKNIIPGDHNDKKVMQSSIGKSINSIMDETNSSINSGPKKNANDIFPSISWHNKIFSL